MDIKLESNLLQTGLNGVYFSSIAGFGLGDLISAIANAPAGGFSGLSGDVSASGTGVVTATVNSVGGQIASAIATAAVAVAAATSLNTPSTLVLRNGSGNFSAGTITASLSGNVTGNVSGTAGNITATSNSTLTTLSSLSLPYSQVTGTPAAAPQILAFTSNPSSGGAVSEALTVTGLLTTDTILSVTQMTQGGATRTSLPLIGWDTVVTNGLTGHWVADPGVGAVLLVAVKR
jgi:hypothetical protein